MSLRDTDYFKLIEACRNGNLKDVKKYLNLDYINGSEQEIEFYVDGKKHYYKPTTPLLLNLCLINKRSFYLLSRKRGRSEYYY